MGRDADGTLHFFEVKYGPSARLTPNQKVALPILEKNLNLLPSQRTLEIIPRGAKAAGIDYHGFKVGVPYKGNYRIDMIRFE